MSDLSINTDPQEITPEAPERQNKEQIEVVAEAPERQNKEQAEVPISNLVLKEPKSV